MNACDRSKQGIETQIASETHNDPEVGVTDACESSKNVPDDIEKVVTDVGPKEVMGGSEHSQNEFAHKNNDMNVNDQYKQGPETDIGTDNPKRPELEGTDVAMLKLILFLHKRVLLMTKVMNLQYYHQRKLWVAVSFPKVNLPTRIMI
jgi:hypothetical protein